MSEFTVTHVAPAEGLQAWHAPDPSVPAVADVQAGVQLQLLERRGAWARVLFSNGWAAWVDGRRLVDAARPEPPPAVVGPVAPAAGVGPAAPAPGGEPGPAVADEPVPAQLVWDEPVRERPVWDEPEPAVADEPVRAADEPV
ncbi:MAG TPA: hypothetical protein VM390_04775, partial [Acidimicrobiales bacterium]|nr:hypothetical protein [Acidimicrobiales bacterium]